MTKQEAVDFLEKLPTDTRIGDANKPVSSILINMSMEALEKQIPRNVIFVHPLQDNDDGDYMCPSCETGTVYDAYGRKSLYCHYCGQALKWE